VAGQQRTTVGTKARISGGFVRAKKKMQKF
jgi:hypothetical protein